MRPFTLPLLSVVATVAVGLTEREPDHDVSSLLQHSAHTHEAMDPSDEDQAEELPWKPVWRDGSIQSGLGFNPIWREGSQVPTFEVDLDMPPQERWREVLNYYRKLIPYMMRAFKPMVEAHLSERMGGVPLAELWVQAGEGKGSSAGIGDEGTAELRGMVDFLNDPNITFDILLLWNQLYELGSLNQACSGVLAAMPNGTVVHGRNLDFKFDFIGPGGEPMDWPNITHNVIYSRGGKALVKGVQWPMHVLGSSGTYLRLADETGSGFSIEQNTRKGASDNRQNLEAAQAGGRFFAHVLRETMLETADFTTALNKISDAKYIAPQYFVMAGGKPYEGAVISIDAMGQHLPGTPEIKRLSASNWTVVQTNDDLNKDPSDPRRPWMVDLLQQVRQSQVDANLIRTIMTSPPASMDIQGTAFTCVWIPATGYFDTIVY